MPTNIMAGFGEKLTAALGREHAPLTRDTAAVAPVKMSTRLWGDDSSHDGHASVGGACGAREHAGAEESGAVVERWDREIAEGQANSGNKADGDAAACAE